MMLKPSRAKPRLSIIIPTVKGRGKYLKTLLSSLLKADIPTEECEIIVICDGKDDEIKQAVKDFRGPIKYMIKFIENEVKVGLTKARNIGIRSSKGRLLIFFDDDVIIHPNYFNYVTERFLKDSEVGCVVGASLIPPFHVDYKETTNLWNLVGKGILKDGGLSGSNMAFPKDVLDELEGFDEQLGVYAYSEDMDIFMRVGFTGYKLVHDNKAMVIHFKAPAGGMEGGGLSPLDYMYYTTRNDTYVYLKNEIWPLSILKALRKLTKRFNLELHSRRITPRNLLKVLLSGITNGLIDAFKLYLVYARNR